MELRVILWPPWMKMAPVTLAVFKDEFLHWCVCPYWYFHLEIEIEKLSEQRNSHSYGRSPKGSVKILSSKDSCRGQPSVPRAPSPYKLSQLECIQRNCQWCGGIIIQLSLPQAQLVGVEYPTLNRSSSHLSARGIRKVTRLLFARDPFESLSFKESHHLLALLQKCKLPCS